MRPSSTQGHGVDSEHQDQVLDEPDGSCTARRLNPASSMIEVPTLVLEAAEDAFGENEDVRAAAKAALSAAGVVFVACPDCLEGQSRGQPCSSCHGLQWQPAFTEDLLHDETT